ncbi:CBS domain-containing protein [Thermonema lapsum]|uniref:CBS domain-containing protein n=1 Tax=Thermonema lapsum TaxID=28195 RepID=A0A846MNP2_9BACT|nr:CBS domain-containing protein [Thermonema lapsum]NIK73089.1 CBS domain-containing protein [Thermonema lapsum]
MKKREPVSHIMTREVYTASINDSLASAYRLMKAKKIRHLPVVEGEQLIGILSITDILRLSFGNEEPDENTLSMFKIEQIMKPNPKTVSPEDEIRTVAEILTQEEFHALPVAEDEKLCGIVTTTDIIKYLLKQY